MTVVEPIREEYSSITLCISDHQWEEETVGHPKGRGEFFNSWNSITIFCGHIIICILVDLPWDEETVEHQRRRKRLWLIVSWLSILFIYCPRGATRQKVTLWWRTGGGGTRVDIKWKRNYVIIIGDHLREDQGRANLRGWIWEKRRREKEGRNEEREWRKKE